MSDGITLHPRLTIVSNARLDVGTAVLAAIKKHGLTYVEINEILLTIALEWNKYAKRKERHPNDPDAKGDEA